MEVVEGNETHLDRLNVHRRKVALAIDNLQMYRDWLKLVYRVE